ncbi:MAG: glycosyltransferase family 39 protein [Patescibacteria group bacterium]
MTWIENNKIRNIILIVVIFFALLIRIFLSSGAIVSSDTAAYYSLAENMAKGELKIGTATDFSKIIQPGFSFFIHLFNLLVNNIELAGQLVSLACSILTIYIIYLLAKKLFGFRVALISSVLFALNPLAIWYSGSPWTESAFTFFFLAAIYLFWVILEKKKGLFWFAVLGTIVAFSYYLRIAGLSLLPVIIVLIFCHNYKIKERNIRKSILSAAVFLSAVILVILPYLIFLFQEKGSFSLTGQQDYAVVLNNQHKTEEMDTEKERDQFLYRLNEDRTDYQINGLDGNKINSSIKVILERFLSNLGYNIKFVFGVFGFEIILTLFAMYYYRKKYKNLRKIWFLLIWIPFYLIIYYFGRPYFRYYFPLSPIIIILSSLGISFLTSKVNTAFLRKSFFGLLIFILLSFQLCVFVYNDYSFQLFSLFKTSEAKSFGLRIKEEAGNDQKIMSTEWLITYYARGIHYPLPVDDYDSILEFSRNRDISHLLLYEPRDRDLRPKLDFLYDVKENNDVRLLFQEKGFYYFEIK